MTRPRNPFLHVRADAATPTIRIAGEIHRDAYNEQDFMNVFALLRESDEVTVEIDSWGGDPRIALEIVQLMKASGVKFRGVIIGSCLSSATLIYLACETREVAGEDTWFMFHRVLGMPQYWINADEMEAAADYMRAIEEYWLDELVRVSGRDREELRGLMDAETWYKGSEIVAAGFAQSLTVAKPDYNRVLMAASLFRNTPAPLVKAQSAQSPTHNPQPNPTIMFDKVKAFFGWTGDDADVAIAAKAAADKLQTLEAKEAEIVRLKADLAARDATIVELKGKADTADTAAATARAVEIDSLVDDAVADFRIQGSAKDAWKTRLQANFEATKEILGELPKDAHKPGRASAPVATRAAGPKVNPAVAAAFGKS